MKCKEQIHSVKDKNVKSVVCDHELTIIEGDGLNQRYDISIECKKSTGGCGFSKKMGNEKWVSVHCEHCNRNLTKEENLTNYQGITRAKLRGHIKVSTGMTCSDCRKFDLISEHFNFPARTIKRTWIQRLWHKERRK